MARSFWTGLGHGAALGGGLLVLMSLVWPLPEPEPPALPGEAVVPGSVDPGAPSPDDSPMAAMPDDQPAAAAEAPVPAAPDMPEVETAAPADEAPAVESPAAEPGTESAAAGAGQDLPSVEAAAPVTRPEGARPEAEAVGLPVGSEFGRGGDVVPRLPTPLTVPSARLDQSDAPAVRAPAAEPAPVTVTGSNARPETPQDRSAPQSPAVGEATPQITRPDRLDLPVLGLAPALGPSDQRDRVPGPLPVAAPPDQRLPQAKPEEPATAAGTAQAATTPAPSVPVSVPAPTPAMPTPALDLSLPPDLSDLRSLERN
ncbi:hypothetical protein [Paracoccus marinaquae]|uniref:Meckel syndrome type 1 protein n=1 Tax=Paracoccus marinaquae TaxID=2841926 RepID=A0ABS6AIS5_9RHOB|nr:hypothetical protein [Paracoccus marinaquae]MBU3030500.1 hypothetical protein [Paracoccus marinaquae]